MAPTGAPVQHRGSRGFYIITDQTVWTDKDNSARTLTAFAQLGIGDSRVNKVGGYIGGGLAFTAPFPRREKDQIGLAMPTALPGSHYERASAMRSSIAAETAIELTYLIQLDARLAVQPDFQYLINPGATRVMRNALVPGVRILLSY